MNHDALQARDDLVMRIARRRERLARYDELIGSMTEARYLEWNGLMDDESRLRTLTHYADMRTEAEASR